MSGKIIEELNKGKEPIFYNNDQLQFMKNPIGKAHYKNALENKDNNKIKIPSQYVECDICGKKYTKYNKNKHIKTKHHIFCKKINKKWRKMILDN